MHPPRSSSSMASHRKLGVLFVVTVLVVTLLTDQIGAHEYECRRGFKTCKKGGACKTDVMSDPKNCGQCGAECPCAAHTRAPKCQNGRCSFECELRQGWRDCDSRKANGCEINVNTNLKHCGVCGNVCPAPQNSTTTCTGGICGFTCNAGFEKCGNMCANVHSSDTSNCGSCGNVCTASKTPKQLALEESLASSAPQDSRIASVHAGM